MLTPEQAEHARAKLREHLPQDGRAGRRDRLTAAKLSREILGRDKDYIRNFLVGDKQTLGASEIRKIERHLGLAAGDLLGPDSEDTVRRVPIEEEQEQFVVSDDPDSVKTAETMEPRKLQPGEVVERNVVGGMGSGGNAPPIIVEGKTLDGVRAVWRLPVDYLRTELRSREHDVDFIPVDGDSMIPTLLPGDRVMINREQTAPSPDGLYAIHDGIGIAVKRLEVVKGSQPIRIRIKSDNPVHGSDEILAADLQVIGRVICKVSRL